MAKPKNRTQLQNLFKSGAKPSEADFKDLIDGALNISDDGIEKPAGADTPLKILTHGDRENVLDIYAGETPTWRLNQKPTADTQGLNLETGGSSKLFVESSTGNLGLSITKPIAKLHIQQTGSQNALRIDDEAGDTTPLIVDADGKVGIGTDKPSVKLDVKGNTAIAGSLSITETLLVTQTSTLTGNVGIGTTEPSHFFHVKTGDSVGLFESTGTQAYLRFSTNEGIGNRVEIANRPGGRLALWTAGGGDKFNITKAGNVGIGKTNPTKLLDVNGDTAITGNLTVSGGITNAEVLQVTAVDRKAHVDTDGAIYRKGGQVYLTVDDNFYIRDSNSASDDIAAHFNTNPDGGLTVNGTGTSSFAGSLAIAEKVTVGNGNNQDLLVFATERSWKFTTSGKGAGTTLDLQSNVAGKTFRVLSEDGTNCFSVGVVNGGGAGNTGGVVNGHFVEFSSRDYKENIRALNSEQAMALLNHLNPVVFNYKGSKERELQLGFIAEDVPDFIASFDKKGIRLTNMMAVLCSVLREEQATILRLQDTVKLLKQRIEDN